MVVVTLVMPSSFLVEQAGPTLDVSGEVDGSPIVEVTGTTTYPSDTSLVMTTVSAYGNADTGAPVGKIVGSLFSKDEQIEPVRALYPKNVTSEEVSTHNTALMANSQDTAAAVAMKMAGMDVSMTLRVVDVDPSLSSGKVIRKDDVIVGISAPATDNKVKDVATFYDLSQVLDETPPGTNVMLSVRRGTDVVQETMTTIAYDPDASGWVNPGSMLGILLDVQDLKLPAEATYAVSGIGGPSAGTMFMLEIYDQMTPGSLGGMRTVAGTGTMSWDGDVGAIGGIAHKLVGAHNAGITDFLAPAANCAETIGYVPDGMNVWAVRSASEAIAATTAIGAGDTSSLQTCESVVDAVGASTSASAAR